MKVDLQMKYATGIIGWVQTEGEEVRVSLGVQEGTTGSLKKPLSTIVVPIPSGGLSWRWWYLPVPYSGYTPLKDGREDAKFMTN